MIEVLSAEDLTDDRLLMAVILSHVCMAMAHLEDSGLETNLNVREAMGLLEPLIRLKCANDDDFDALMQVARNQINSNNYTLN